ncbi:EAL domain-containing protein [uncultured Lamprocystis sp.]|uniref:EAL domain-containing protein n=1 Tax=uncultured Lamprocystis sp. TaxID=543132 RepID=UPI0025FD51A1|nr:EAL domain-containing protein [uncultured Lamprocystis sp.]
MNRATCARRWRWSLALATLFMLGLAVPGDLNGPNQIDVAGSSPLTWNHWQILGPLALGLMLLNRWLLAPLRRLRACAEQLAAGRYDRVSGVGGIGAVADLAATLDRLSEQLRSQDSLQSTDTHLVVAERKPVERSLSYLVALDTVLVEASRTLLTAQPEALDHVVIRVLGAVARRMDVERAYLYQVSSDSQQLSATHEWCAMNVAERRVTADPVPLTSLPRWMDTLRHGESVAIGDVDLLPDPWALDRQILLATGVRAILAVPLRVGGRLAGCVVVEVEGAPRTWQDPEIRVLRLLADLIGVALERRKVQQELIEGRQRLEEAARYDTLTGLPNRRLLAERMREAMGVALDSATELAVCSLDLDGFKAINDACGEVVGDQILVAVAARLRDQIRESDTVARLGGDEFVLLLGGFENPLECANLLDRLITALAQPHVVGDQELRVTASAGITLFPRDANDADTLLRHADHAMYRAKQRGRNRYRFFDPLRDRRLHDRLSQLERIGAAIDDGELVLYYQPKVDMRLGNVIGAEGLVRWQHPQKGLLPPGVFIPLLAGTEYQQRLDWWVLQEGLNQLQTWHDHGLDLELSLNISAHSIQHNDFIHNLDEQLHVHPGLATGVLSLEILESEALGDLEAVARVMQHCAKLGVRFALDDFGTGYSSLTYFRRLPAQVLKIDQMFVRDMLRSPDDRNIVEGVVGLAHAFRREVIAEGVESAAHGLMLLRLGCDRAQGYGIAEPMPATQFPDWVSRYRFPALWRITADFEWSEPILNLLAMESEHRDWVASLIQALGSNPNKTPPTMEEKWCGFGRWYHAEGRRLYGTLPEFRRLEPLHHGIHDLGRTLTKASAQGRSTEAAIADIIAARDGFIIALHALQEQVLSEGVAETGPN